MGQAWSIRKIKQHNSQKFLDDVNRISEFVVAPELTNRYFKVLKREVMEAAERMEIKYYISDKVFRNRRQVIVLI